MGVKFYNMKIKTKLYAITNEIDFRQWLNMNINFNDMLHWKKTSTKFELHLITLKESFD